MLPLCKGGEVRGMRITCVGELAEVSSVEESNKLLEEGWELCKVISHPDKCIMIFVRYAPINKVN